MSTMLEEMNRARKEGYALGAFNFFNYLSAQAVIEAAEECHKPVILQTSVKTVKYYGARELHAMVADLPEELEGAGVSAPRSLQGCRLREGVRGRGLGQHHDRRVRPSV